MGVVRAEELELMKKGGRITGKVLRTVLGEASEGMRLSELEERASELITSFGGQASFATVPGYPYATCINVNEGVVHGIPSEYNLKNGDLLSVDMGVLYEGFHTDSAWSVIVGGDSDKEMDDFLRSGKRALEKAISKCLPGNTVGDISKAISNVIEGSGYTVSKDLVGHGIGRDLHENPQIPGFLDPDSSDIPLIENMAIAVEVIYMKGESPIAVDLEDRWTITTRDGSIAALFEHSLVITSEGPIVLTRDD